MNVSQCSIYRNSYLTSIVPLYSRKRHQVDQTKDKYSVITAYLNL